MKNIIFFLKKLLLLNKLLNLLYIFSLDSNLLELFSNGSNNINQLIENNSNIEENPDDEEKHRNYTNRNILFLKILISISIIGVFQLNTEQIGCVIVANLISELIDTVVFYNDGEFVDKDNNNTIIENVEKEKEVGKEKEVEKIKSV